MKKRILSFILLTTMVVSLLAGCGSKETSNDVTNTQTTENSVISESILDIELETESVTEEIEATEVVEETTETQQEQTGETEQTTVTYTFEDLQATMYAKQSVNVRSLPSTDGEKLGALSYAQEVNVTGKCVETGWYRIDFNGSVGYVSNNYLVSEKPQEQPETPSEPTEPSQPSGRYGGYWDYIGGEAIYTGATLYTNATYGTSFTVPSTSQVYRDDHPNVVNCKSPIILTMCYPSNADITLILTFAKNGNTETEALEDWRTTWGYSLWTCSDIYTTDIGGNTYYCMEATSPNGSSNELMLARQTGGKVIVYRLTSNSTKVTTDTARNYILY